MCNGCFCDRGVCVCVDIEGSKIPRDFIRTRRCWERNKEKMALPSLPTLQRVIDGLSLNIPRK